MPLLPQDSVPTLSTEEIKKLFDASDERQRERERKRALTPQEERGWTRDDLYFDGDKHL